MADVVREIEITAALSADYQDAFKAATSIAASSAKELQQLTKREKDLNAMVKLSSDAAAAAADGNAKEAAKLASQYDKLAERLGLVDKSAKGVADELAKVGARKADVKELNAQASKSAAFGKLARDIQTYTKAAKKTKDPAIIKQLDSMKKKFREMGGVIPDERKLGFFSKLKSSLSQLPGPIGKIASGFGSMSKAALVIGGFAAIGTAAVALTKKMWDLGVSTIKAADEIAKTSKQLGINAEAYQEFAWAVGLGGASEQDLASGLQQLNKQMEAATAGNSKAQKAFKSLGISMDEVKSMNTEEMFVRISDALSQVDDVTAKTKTTMDLFGGSGVKLAEAIKGGSAALDEMRKEARESGYVLSNDELERAEEAADNYERAMMQVKGALRAVGVEVMPMINKGLLKFVDLVRENKDKIRPFVKGLGDGLRFVIKVIRGVKDAFSAASEIITGGLEWWKNDIIQYGKTCVMIAEGIGHGFVVAKDWVVEAFDAAYDAVSGFFTSVGEWWDGTLNDASEAVDGIKEYFSNLPSAIMDEFDALATSLGEWWSGVKSSASQWVSELVDSLVGFIMDKLNWLSDSLKSIPLIGQLLEDEPAIAKGSGGSVTINVNNSVDARGAAPGAGSEIARAVRASDGQTGQSIAAALGSYNDLAYAG